MIRAVAVRELKGLWTSPLPYVLGAAFHLALGVLGSSQLVGRQQAVFQPIVPIAGFLLLIAAPVLCSRAVADEVRSGSLDVLLAIPVGAVRLVTGKYLALSITMSAVLAPSGLFAAVLFTYGDPDAGPVLTGSAGLVAMLLAACAVGLAASSLTASQPAAAVGALAASLTLWFAHAGSEVAPTGGVQAALSISERLRSFASGTIEATDVTYFVSVVAAGLAVSALAVRSRRWP